MARVKISDLNNKHFLALGGNVFMAIMAIVVTGLLTRSLSMADLGAWFYLNMVCALADATRNGLLGTAVIRFYAGTSRTRGQEVLGSVWFLSIAVTAIFVLINAAFLPFLPHLNNEVLATSIKWFGATVVSTMPFNIIFSILTAEERYGKILLLRLINYGSMIIYMIALVALEKMTLENFLWCNFLTNCLCSMVGLAWGLGQASSFFHRSWACIFELVRYGRYTMGTTFVSRLFSSADTNIIPFLLGPGALAVYGIALTLMGGVEIILRSFVGTGLSGMAIAYNHNDHEHTAYIMKKYTGMLTLAFIPLSVLVLVFAGPAISILGGRNYTHTDAAGLFRIFMFIAWLYPLDRFIGATLDIIHKPKINFYKVLIMLAFSVAGDFLFISLFHNLYGVALATFCTTLAGIIFGYTHLNRFIKVPLPGITAPNSF
jgi:O-antigen/teichoic acid export membrane protein